MRKHHLILLLSVFLAGLSGAVLASDIAKEKRWADQIIEGLISGEPQWLEANGQKFLAIYTPHNAATAKGAVILLHGIGAHPDWPDVIHPLRTGLPDDGWDTLSLQMPVLGNDATLEDYIPLFDEVPARIEAGMAFLAEQGATNIIVIGHSLGATMAAAYLAEHPNARARAFIGIGMSGSKLDPRLDATVSLTKIGLPVFDLYGSRDLDSVLASVKARAAAARRAGNTDYRQQAIEGADHFFIGLEDALYKRVMSWLEKFAPDTDQ